MKEQLKLRHKRAKKLGDSFCPGESDSGSGLLRRPKVDVKLWRTLVPVFEEQVDSC